MALPNDASRISDGVAMLEESRPGYTGSRGPKNAARRLIRRTIVLEKAAADGAAATATTSDAAPGFVAPTDGRLLGAKFLPHAALTADPTNNATLSVDKRDGAGGAATQMATGTTTAGGTGSFVTAVPVALTLSATLANLRWAKNQLVSFAISKGGTGVVVPAGSWVIDIEEESSDAYPV